MATFKLKTSAAKPKLNLRLPAPIGWATILGFVALVTLALLAHAGGALNYLYPVVALAVGGFLCRCYPRLYLGFTLWLWFLTPEVRRLVDFQQGWNAESPVMLAPYLVTALTLFTLLRHLPKLRFSDFCPFGLILVGLFYGYSVGVFGEQGPLAATFDLLNWLVPAMFAFHFLVHWRSYPWYRHIIQRTFIWGVLVMGLYGLLQFLYLPAWDRYWMLSAPINSVGSPEPLGVRVFSTLNSPGPFAIVMMAGLLLLLSGSDVLRWPAAVAGYASLLLSLVRSAWGGWIVGLLFIVGHYGYKRPRVLVVLAATGLITLSLLLVGPIADTLNERLQTITNLQQDTSFQARLAFYSEFTPQALLNPVGDGLGSTGVATKLGTPGEELGSYGNFDSGLMNITFVLGWPGSLLYVGGLGWLLSYTLRSEKVRSDLFAVTSQGITVAVLAQLIFVNTLIGVTGMVFWVFLGLSLAARRYTTSGM